MIDYLKIFILSGVPVIEGRGALSIAYLSGLNLNSALLIAILGNIIIIPITFWLLKISNFFKYHISIIWKKI